MKLKYFLLTLLGFIIWGIFYLIPFNENSNIYIIYLIGIGSYMGGFIFGYNLYNFLFKKK